MSMCDRIALMKDGKIVQLSEPDQMYNDPVDTFVAGFLGNPPISFLDATVADGQFRVGDSGIAISQELRPKVTGQVQLGIRPEYFGPQFGNGLQGQISFVETQGREDLYNVTLPNGAVLRSIQPAGPRLKLGETVNWGVASDHALAFTPEGARI